METNFLQIAAFTFGLFVFGLLLFFSSIYRRCPPNKILALYGKVGAGNSVKCFHGGGTFILPLIQNYKFLNLTPMVINIPLKGALSQQNIRINVPSTFTIAIETTQESMKTAAVRLLDLSPKEIETMCSEIIFGQLRLTVASLTIEQINQDREMFLDAIRNNIDLELKKIGLILINVNITDITDESEYIDSIGQKAAASAVNQAKVDVSLAKKRGDIGSAEAEKDRRISVASFNAESVEGENESQAKIASYNADLAEREAEADKKGKVARQNANAEIQKAKAMAETSRLEADEVVPREIEKRKIEINAQAEAEKIRLEAIGRAEAILSIKSAEAEGIQKVLTAKSEGYKQIVEACKGKPQEAATLLMVEKMDEIVRLQTEAIKNIKFDKITVWDSGNSEKGSSTANFVSSLIKSLPALHEISAMAGVKLPEFLGKTADVTHEEPVETVIIEDEPDFIIKEQKV